MDEISGLLEGPRARGAFLLRCELDSPFAVRVQDQAPLTLLVVTRGATHVVSDDPSTAPVHAQTGDVVVLPGPTPYTVCSRPDVALQSVIGTDQGCRPRHEATRPPTMLGTRTWGHRDDAETAILVGTYPVQGELGTRLVRSLPVLTRLAPADLGDTAALGALSGLLHTEIERDTPGQDVVLDRSLDLLLATVLRAWFAGPAAPIGARARQDPALGPALRAMEADPGRGWTVAGLARTAGLSRAAFARRFAEQVGTPPMAWLTDLRLTLATDLLRGSDLPLAAVADRVGYASPFALSAAFLRERGHRPATLRTPPTPETATPETATAAGPL